MVLCFVTFLCFLLLLPFDPEPQHLIHTNSFLPFPPPEPMASAACQDFSWNELAYLSTNTTHSRGIQRYLLLIPTPCFSYWFPFCYPTLVSGSNSSSPQFVSDISFVSFSNTKMALHWLGLRWVTATLRSVAVGLAFPPAHSPPELHATVILKPPWRQVSLNKHLLTLSIFIKFTIINLEPDGFVGLKGWVENRRKQELTENIKNARQHENEWIIHVFSRAVISLVFQKYI